MNRSSLTRFAWISIVAALATLALKTWAYFITGSVGLLSDAVESVVNLIGGFMALAMVTVAARPADEDHACGHGKVEPIADAGGIMPSKSTWFEPKLHDAMFCRMF